MQPCRRCGEKRTAICLALVLIAVETGTAEQARLSFRRAVRTALARSPEIDYQERLVKIFSERLSPVIAERIPVLSLSYTGSSEYLEGEPLAPLHRIDIGAEIELFDGGRTFLQARRHRLQTKSRSLRLKKTKEEMRLRVAELYAGALLSAREVEVREESYETAYRYLRIARTRLERGTITAGELSETVIELKRLGISLKRSRLSRSRYRSLLSELTGIGNTRFTGALPGDYRSVVECAEPSPEQLLEAAGKRSFEIRNSERRIRSALIARKESRRRHCPSLHLFSSIGFEGEDFPPVAPEVTVGIRIATPVPGASISYTGSGSAQHYGRSGSDAVSAEFPLYREYTEGAVAEADLRRSRAQRHRSELGLRREVGEKYGELELEQRKLELSRETVLHREEELGRIRLLFEEGEESLSALFEAILALAEARLSHSEAVTGLFLSEYELLSLCGMEEKAFERAIGFFSPDETASPHRAGSLHRDDPLSRARSPHSGAGGKQ